jgi:predicted transcriptional regulator
MSIRPVYADRILSGEKRFEIRRRPVRLLPGDLVVVYSSAPVKAIVGAFSVRQVHIGTTESLWRRFSVGICVSRPHYLEYLRGTEHACAIEVGHVIQLPLVALSDLRSSPDGFRPPQSYMFLNEAQGASLRGIAAQALAQTAMLSLGALPVNPSA